MSEFRYRPGDRVRVLKDAYGQVPSGTVTTLIENPDYPDDIYIEHGGKLHCMLESEIVLVPPAESDDHRAAAIRVLRSIAEDATADHDTRRRAAVDLLMYGGGA